MLPAQVGMAACLPLGRRSWSSSVTLPSPAGSQPRAGAQLGRAGHLPPLCWGCPRQGAAAGLTLPEGTAVPTRVDMPQGSHRLEGCRSQLGAGALDMWGGDPSGNGRGLPRRLAGVVTGRATFSLPWAGHEAPHWGESRQAALTESTGVPVHAQASRRRGSGRRSQLVLGTEQCLSHRQGCTAGTGPGAGFRVGLCPATRQLPPPAGGGTGAPASHLGPAPAQIVMEFVLENWDT